jgi:hypothetical protein
MGLRTTRQSSRLGSDTHITAVVIMAVIMATITVGFMAVITAAATTTVVFTAMAIAKN